MHISRSLLISLSLGVMLFLVLPGCSSNGVRIDRMAQSAGLQKQIVPGIGHSHVVYEKRHGHSPGPDRLLIFLEGDGSPWGSSGMQPASDPTSRNPLALRMMLASEANAIYVARPCYHELVDANCSAEAWTGGRYSSKIVDSMANVIEHESRKFGATELMLIGYSGGGALAILIAERLHHIAAVVTIGANLDIVAWANHHHYLPLAQSLNPAQSERAHTWPEFHFRGSNDSVVPADTVESYFQRYPSARRLPVDNADHVCCWEQTWPALLASVEREMQ